MMKFNYEAYNNVEEILRSLSSRDKVFDVKMKSLEYPILQTSTDHKAVVGFVDLYVSGIVTTINGSDETRFDASIEIKNEIQCCGDLIRQINFISSLRRLDRSG